jgi:hypothetical protein
VEDIVNERIAAFVRGITERECKAVAAVKEAAAAAGI